jgi:hypothetical protein
VFGILLGLPLSIDAFLVVGDGFLTPFLMVGLHSGHQDLWSRPKKVVWAIFVFDADVSLYRLFEDHKKVSHPFLMTLDLILQGETGFCVKILTLNCPNLGYFILMSV